MNFDKESKSRIFFIFFFWGGGGGGGGEREREGAWGGGEDITTRVAIFFYTRHIIMTSFTEPNSLMKVFQTVFKIEGFVALPIKGR